jgi:purine catabolism regulator
MKTAKVKSAREYLSLREVEWISVIEMPVENFVRKNEFVLSTAVGCGHDPEMFMQFVQDIIDSEASALVLATGRHIFDIPKEVLELAERQNFIIIELPWEIRFADVVQDVMKLLNDFQQEELKKSEKIQQQLLKLILQEENLSQIARFVEKSIKYPIIITNRAGEIIGKSNHIQLNNNSWPQYLSSGRISSYQGDTTHHPMLQKIQKIQMDQYTLLQLPVMHTSYDIQGYLFVILPNNLTIDSVLNKQFVNVLEHAVTTIALWFSRKNAVEEAEMRLRSDFIWELAQGHFSSVEQANSRAKSLGYNLNLPYVSIVGYPENLTELYTKRNQHDHSFHHWKQNMIRYIEEEVIYAGKSLKRSVMVTFQQENLIIFFETLGNKKKEVAYEFLDLVERRLRHLLPGVMISWGIGGFYEGVSGFANSFQEAAIAMKIGRNKKGKGQRIPYEETKIDRILLNLTDNKEMKKIMMSIIHPLVQYDEERKMDLIGTFISYIRNHGNVSQTARELNLHRQSLLYRLRKIESLTGLSLIDPDDLFLLDLCIKIWKIGAEGSKDYELSTINV